MINEKAFYATTGVYVFEYRGH